jgi:hypothetical protein
MFARVAESPKAIANVSAKDAKKRERTVNVNQLINMSDTPRTDAAYFARGATMYDLAGESKRLERELNEAKSEIERLTDACGFFDNLAKAKDNVIKEINADRLRLREALSELRDWYKENFGLPAVKANAALDTLPPPVVAKADADALASDLNAIRLICEAEGMIVTIGDKTLKTYRTKYSTQTQKQN